MSEAVIARRGGKPFDFSGANATANYVLSGAKGYNSTGTLITGTMVNRGAWSTTVSPGSSVTIPAGYHNGSGKVTAGTVARTMAVRSIVKDETITIPENVDGAVMVTAIGGGGKDANGESVSQELSIPGGTEVPVTVGNGNQDGNGGTTSFGTYLSANGGGDTIDGGNVADTNGALSDNFGTAGNSGGVVLQYYTKV